MINALVLCPVKQDNADETPGANVGDLDRDLLVLPGVIPTAVSVMGTGAWLKSGSARWSEAPGHHWCSAALPKEKITRWRMRAHG